LKPNDTQHRDLMAQTDIYESLLTPCFVFDADEMRKSVDGFRKALEKNFSKSVVGYSVKTNSLPYCISKARKFGAYAEVVSHDEYELALLCGFPTDKIIYNGPMKSEETFVEAIEGGAIVNIETKRELQWLKLLNPSKMHKVGLRLSINLSKVSPEDADGDNDDSRFGFSDATSEFSDALNAIASLPNVQLAGLHIHRTVHSRSVRFYERSVAYACSVIKKYGLALDYLDIGGGFFGIFPGKPTFQQYSDAIYGVLQSNGLEDLCLIVEPGNALVASSCTFVSEVIDVKQSESEVWYVTTNGSRNDIDPFFRKTEYLDEEIYQHPILPPPLF